MNSLVFRPRLLGVHRVAPAAERRGAPLRCGVRPVGAAHHRAPAGAGLRRQLRGGVPGAGAQRGAGAGGARGGQQRGGLVG